MALEIDQQPASFTRRAGAYLIDGVVVGIIWFAIAVVAAYPGNDPDTEGYSEPWRTIFDIIVLALPLFWFVYQWTCNALGVSIGKKLLSLSIEMRDSGGTPGLWSGLLRTIGQAIGAACLGFGFWAALWHPDNLAWHDSMSGTRVFRLNIERPAVRQPARLGGVRRLAERAGLPGLASATEPRNLRFLCDPSPDAPVPYVELRRDGIRFEDARGLHGVRYADIEEATTRPSGEVELRFKSRDTFDRPIRETVLLAVHDREPFLLELQQRMEAVAAKHPQISR